MTGNILRETHFDNLGELKTGKVRDIYFQPDKLILVATDRHSSFDRIIAHVPNKGAVLNLSSAFWFRQTADIVPTHVIATPGISRKNASTPQKHPAPNVAFSMEILQFGHDFIA